jgi:hypothetical protein
MHFNGAPDHTLNQRLKVSGTCYHEVHEAHEELEKQKYLN